MEEGEETKGARREMRGYSRRDGRSDREIGGGWEGQEDVMEEEDEGGRDKR